MIPDSKASLMELARRYHNAPFYIIDEAADMTHKLFNEICPSQTGSVVVFRNNGHTRDRLEAYTANAVN